VHLALRGAEEQQARVGRPLHLQQAGWLGMSVHCVLTVPPPGLYGVAGTGLLWDVSTLCAVAPPPGLYGA
jgi:hypothetical protein